MDKFEQAEELAKVTFKDFCEQQKNLTIKRFTQGKYDPYDVVYTNKKQLMMGEIKKRKYDSI